MRKLPVLLWLLIAAVTGALLVAAFPEVVQHLTWLLFTAVASCAMALLLVRAFGGNGRG